MKTFVNIVSWVLIVVLAALAIAFAGVRLFGLTPFAVLSGSMEPQYPVGSLIYVHEVDPASIQPGDAVTFENGAGQVATHQAYEVDSEQQLIRTQGINNKSSDGTLLHDAEPVPFSQVIGVPVACIPVLGYVNAFVTSGIGTFVVIAGVVIVIALLVVANWGEQESAPVQGKHARR